MIHPPYIMTITTPLSMRNYAWCEAEIERINKQPDRHAEVKKERNKQNIMKCWIQETDPPLRVMPIDGKGAPAKSHFRYMI